MNERDKKYHHKVESKARSGLKIFETFNPSKTGQS